MMVALVVLKDGHEKLQETHKLVKKLDSHEQIIFGGLY